ncbi:MAG: hypothetical protein U0X20_22250 [Caldilineaceae bacterium]
MSDGLAHGTVKHFGLHCLDNVELRVVADDETGILRRTVGIDVVGRLSGRYSLAAQDRDDVCPVRPSRSSGS